MTKSKRPGRSPLAPKIAKAINGLSNGTYEYLREASRASGTSPATLSRHLNGGLTRHGANVKNQALTPTQELALVTFVKHATAVGHPIRHSYLRELADVLRRTRVEDDRLPELGKKWVSRFLQRHPDVKSQVAKSIEAARAEVTKEQIIEWFRQYQEEIGEHNIEPENIYNMDESGNPP